MSTLKHKIHNNDSKMLLKTLLKEACQKHQIAEEVHADLIENGVKKFSIYSDGSIMPTAGYQTVDDFVEQQKHVQRQETTPEKSTKEELLVEMARYARTANMSAYKECRKQYSECD